MEVFIRNLPDQSTVNGLNKLFAPLLSKFGVHHFDCRKLFSRGCATLTILEEEGGASFIQFYGQPASTATPAKLIYLGRQIYCSRSKNAPDEWLLASLEMQRKEKLRMQVNLGNDLQRSFEVMSLACGLWDYVREDPIFVSHFQDCTLGTVKFGPNALTISFPIYLVDIPYYMITTSNAGNKISPSLTLSLIAAPKIYKKYIDDDLTRSLALPNSGVPARKSPEWKRVSSMGPEHQGIASTCFVYRLGLINARDILHILGLKEAKEVPASSPLASLSMKAETTLAKENSELKGALTLQYSNFPFDLKFQLQKLSQNGCLTPRRVMQLLPKVSEIMDRIGGANAADVVRKLQLQIPFAGPQTGASELRLPALVLLMTKSESLIRNEGTYAEEVKKRHEHIVMVYRATVTPAGTYLYGPEPEVTNRVLRKYSKFTSYFMRVSFLEEDGESLRFETGVSNEEIYHGRFQGVLDNAIDVAGRRFEFLGFSHSSLRSQTCWFMAPFLSGGELLMSKIVIARLGNFSMIRCPAKCAARIGQAFTDTLSSVEIPGTAVEEIDDVEAFGRVFSDGVGTISAGLLARIWKKHRPGARLHPTLYQIRYAGAKGMISYDSRLLGDRLCLRPSMIKFSGSDATAIEVCGAAYTPLPMYLNRQLIKILEDLGVPSEIFHSLQEDALEHLKMMTSSAINAAIHLEYHSIGLAAQLPWLLRCLESLRLPFQTDDFLRGTVEMAALLSLRDLKYRSRIPVEKGVTLYGIMDETSYLKEGEIFCVTDSPTEGRNVITGVVTITRSPALHPGDVQVVRAVNVPADSPLFELHNCVVFSQKGKRDLPSQLSGGDLDGDLYNVIYHEGLLPKRTFAPADYPRLSAQDIGRPVERRDMYEFFLRFMESDQLGRIAILHQVLADQSPAGTADARCVILADLHSTAVDFSKTGIPVDLSRLPKHNSYRPDFMAPGPHIKIDKELKYEDVVNTFSSAFSEEGSARTRYYESKKVLGTLYRAIDERGFFLNLRERLRKHEQSIDEPLVMKLWRYVSQTVSLLQWHHYVDWAWQMRDMYEDHLNDTMHQYSVEPSRPLSELEVFIGNIVGKNGAQSRRQRDLSKGLKDKFDRDVTFTIDNITGRDGGDRDEALPRAVACLSVGLCEDEKHPLRSFQWVAAATCLKEMLRLEGGVRLRRSESPRLDSMPSLLESLYL